MSYEEVKNGQQWVLEKLLQVANDLNFPIKNDNYKWKDQNGNYLLVIEINGKKYEEKFTEENLEDCMGDKTVKDGLEKQVHGIVKLFQQPKKRIGF